MCLLSFGAVTAFAFGLTNTSFKYNKKTKPSRIFHYEKITPRNSPTTRSHIISRPFIPLGTPLTTSPTCQDWLFVIKFGGNSRVVKMVASPLTRLAETGFAWKVRLPRELRAVSTHEGVSKQSKKKKRFHGGERRWKRYRLVRCISSGDKRIRSKLGEGEVIGETVCVTTKLIRKKCCQHGNIACFGDCGRSMSLCSILKVGWDL
ncbi:unnamed protein product [Arabidopsis lyrata]|nr:unnamed protein product [Arabidopsis lyrata]